MGVAILAASGPRSGASASYNRRNSGARRPHQPHRLPRAAPELQPVRRPRSQTDASGIKEMLDYYENGFAKAVAALSADQLDKSALPLYIIVDHYQGNLLPLAGKVPIWADDVYTAVDSKLETYNALVKVIADLTSALVSGPNPRLGVFYKDDPNYKAPAKLKDAKKKLVEFQASAKYCQKAHR